MAVMDWSCDCPRKSLSGYPVAMSCTLYPYLALLSVNAHEDDQWLHMIHMDCNVRTLFRLCTYYQAETTWQNIQLDSIIPSHWMQSLPNSYYLGRSPLALVPSVTLSIMRPWGLGWLQASPDFEPKHHSSKTLSIDDCLHHSPTTKTLHITYNTHVEILSR